jgi:hypothetical protein
MELQPLYNTFVGRLVIGQNRLGGSSHNVYSKTGIEVSWLLAITYFVLGYSEEPSCHGVTKSGPERFTDSGAPCSNPRVAVGIPAPRHELETPELELSVRGPLRCGTRSASGQEQCNDNNPFVLRLSRFTLFKFHGAYY